MPKNLDSPKSSPFKKPQLPPSPSKVVKKKVTVPKIPLQKSESFINMIKRTGSDLKELVSPRKSITGSSPRELNPISLSKSQKSITTISSKKELKKDEKLLIISPRDQENLQDNHPLDDQDLSELIKDVESPKNSPKSSPKISPKKKTLKSPEIDGQLIDEYGFDVPLMFIGTPKKSKPFFK